MEIILISKRRGKRARICLNYIAFLAIFGIVAGFAAAASWGGYAWAGRQVTALESAERVAGEDQAYREVRAQGKAIKAIERETELSLNALAARLARLQSRLIRLDALGSRLTAMANLPEDEFRFDSAPPLGGPLEPGELRSVEIDELLQSLSSLTTRLSEKEDELAALENLLMNRRLEEETSPAGRPVRSGWISSGYGKRTDPVSGKQEFHSGLDFAGRVGSEVLAVAAGVVTWSGKKAAYGHTIEINHGNGFITRYSHNKQNLVGVGDKVEKNQLIARMGSSGRSTGPHVHFEVVRDGKLVNPRTYVNARH